jgi:polyphosphate kinase 2 (PPK2 family)
MAKDDAAPKMKPKAYEKELRKLQVELCHLQEWVKAKKLRAVICSRAAMPPARAAPSRP